jgi:hypothetical protein
MFMSSFFNYNYSVSYQTCASCSDHHSFSLVELLPADATRRLIFPFTAIVGQDEMKLSLILNVIDPKIGGVMIMGDRGTGKTTAVRALADLLPEMKVVDKDYCNSGAKGPRAAGGGGGGGGGEAGRMCRCFGKGRALHKPHEKDTATKSTQHISNPVCCSSFQTNMPAVNSSARDTAGT